MSTPAVITAELRSPAGTVRRKKGSMGHGCQIDAVTAAICELHSTDDVTRSLRVNGGEKRENEKKCADKPTDEMHTASLE